jgi:GT2 family glycosyltransferase
MITVSVVSHGHGALLAKLLEQVLAFPEIGQVVVTLNISESIELPKDNRIRLIQNQVPKGFGANHNYAFSKCKSSYFCVLNPDIALNTNPFPFLLSSVIDASVGLVAPMVNNKKGEIEDSFRRFPSLKSFMYRYFLLVTCDYEFRKNESNFCVEWVGGMCMLFPSTTYTAINGFDEQYFMYVEDADICTRLWLAGYKVLACPGAVVIHDARRASRKNLQHFRWHLTSLFRYFWKYTGRLPRLP